MSNISPEEKAQLLEQSFLENLTGEESRHQGQNKDIWGDGSTAFVLLQGEIEVVFDQTAITYEFGTGNGLHTGIYPVIEGYDRGKGKYRATRLDITPEGEPQFRILPVLGATAVQHA